MDEAEKTLGFGDVAGPDAPAETEFVLLQPKPPFVVLAADLDGNPYPAINEMQSLEWAKLGPVSYVPHTPRPPVTRHVEVTPEMIAAGADSLREYDPDYETCVDRATAIYRAMAAVSPGAVVSDGELAAVRERDEARESWRTAISGMRQWQNVASNRLELIEELRAERDAAQRNFEQCCEMYNALRDTVAAKDARIAELDTRLASTPVAFEDPDAKPPPAPGFLTAIRRGNKATVGMVTGRGDMPRVAND